VKRPCEKTWREILEWAWSKGVDDFTHNDLLRENIVNYRGSRREQVWSVSATLRHMWKARLLTRLAAGKGRSASLYAPITRERYEQMVRQLVGV
jgi:hypothetical protein